MRFPTLALAMVLALPSLSLAATLNVNSTADTLVAGDGQCTLREAIINANGDSDTTAGDCAAGSGADLINVPAGSYALAIPGANEDASATGDLDITSDLTLRGAGAAVTVIDARRDNVIEVRGSSTVAAVERVTVTGHGPGSFFPGAIVNFGTVTMSDCVVSGNQVGCTGFFGSCGGTILDRGVSMTVRRCAITRNSGPAIAGGGDHLVQVENTTISANTAKVGLGCDRTCFCVSLLPAAIDGSVKLVHSTVADNLLDPSPPSPCSNFPQLAVQGELDFKASVVSNPGLTNCLLALGYVTSAGSNIDSDGSCGLTDPTDLSNVDPMLGPLHDNGGPTPTHALLRGSPAIDRISVAACTYDHDGDPSTPEVALTTDQRGGTRPREGDGTSPSGCDAGAYEVAACADGRDNDGDGLVDFDGGATAGLTPLASPDPNCGSALGSSEAPPSSVGGCGVGPELLLALLLLGRRARPGRAEA
jgi:CSLREA domain-containing protein